MNHLVLWKIMKFAMKTEYQIEFGEVITLNARYNANDRR